MNRNDFKVTVPTHSYEDLLFYEKKALKLEKVTDFINQSSFKIDMQMNLREYLFKITPANINNKDLEQKLIPENFKLGNSSLANLKAKKMD